MKCLCILLVLSNLSNYHNQSGYESQAINLIEMFGQELVIEQI